MAITADWANAIGVAGSTSSSVSVTKPAGVSVGDALLMLVAAYDDAAITATPSGWTPTNTLTPVRESTTEVLNLFAWVRVLDGSEGASFTVNLSSSQYHNYAVVTVKGAHASAPYESSSPTNGRASTQSLAGGSTAQANELVIGAKVGYNQAISGNPSNWTSRLTYDTVCRLYDRTVVSAGSFAAESLTVPLADGWVSLAVAFTDTVSAGSTYPVNLLSSRTPFSTNYRGSL